MTKRKGRGRPKGPPTTAITVRVPVTLLRRVRARLGDDSLTAFVIRALGVSVSEPANRMEP